MREPRVAPSKPFPSVHNHNSNPAPPNAGRVEKVKDFHFIDSFG